MSRGVLVFFHRHPRAFLGTLSSPREAGYDTIEPLRVAGLVESSTVALRSDGRWYAAAIDASAQITSPEQAREALELGAVAWVDKHFDLACLKRVQQNPRVHL